MKYKIIKKAWILNFDQFNEPWCYDRETIFYGTKSQVKKDALCEYNGASQLNGDDLNFLNIRVIRSKNNDEILVNDKIIKRFQLKNIERLNKISKLPKDKFYYIQDRRSYVGNSVLWWCAYGGYDTDIMKARKFSWLEINSLNPREFDIIWQSDHVEKAIKKIVDMQYLEREFSI